MSHRHSLGQSVTHTPAGGFTSLGDLGSCYHTCNQPIDICSLILLVPKAFAFLCRLTKKKKKYNNMRKLLISINVWIFSTLWTMKELFIYTFSTPWTVKGALKPKHNLSIFLFFFLWGFLSLFQENQIIHEFQYKRWVPHHSPLHIFISGKEAQISLVALWLFLCVSFYQHCNCIPLYAPHAPKPSKIQPGQ